MCFWDERGLEIGEKIEARGDKSIATGYESRVVGREGLAKYNSQSSLPLIYFRFSGFQSSLLLFY